MNVPNRYKGFSQLPENVQQRMDPSLAKKYQMGGSVMQRPLFRQLGGPTDMMPQDMMPPPAQMAGPPMPPPPMAPPPMAPPPMDPMAEQMMAAESMGESAGANVADAMMMQIDGAQDYESLIDGIRGNELPLDARYQELAGLVGEADAMATPESVLALTQPTIMMTEQGAMDSGIGELMQGIAGDVEMSGPMDDGVGSLMAAGAGNTPPVNFRNGGPVEVRGYAGQEPDSSEVKPGGGTPLSGIMAQAQANAPAYQKYFAGAMDSEARAEQLEEQKKMAQAQMLFDVAGTALAFAGNTEGNTIAERLANAASQTQLTDKIGARSASVLSAKQAQQAEDRQLRMAGLTASLTDAQTSEAARQAQILAEKKKKSDYKKLYRLNDRNVPVKIGEYNVNDFSAGGGRDQFVFASSEAGQKKLGFAVLDTETIKPYLAAQEVAETEGITGAKMEFVTAQSKFIYDTPSGVKRTVEAGESFYIPNVDLGKYNVQPKSVNDELQTIYSIDGLTSRTFVKGSPTLLALLNAENPEYTLSSTKYDAKVETVEKKIVATFEAQIDKKTQSRLFANQRTMQNIGITSDFKQQERRLEAQAAIAEDANALRLEIQSKDQSFTNERDQTLQGFKKTLMSYQSELDTLMQNLKGTQSVELEELKGVIRERQSKITANLNLANTLEVAGVKNAYEISKLGTQYERNVAIVKLKDVLSTAAQTDQNSFVALQNVLDRVSIKENKDASIDAAATEAEKTRVFKALESELNRDFKGTEAEKKASALLLQNLVNNNLSARGLNLQAARDQINQAKSEAKTTLDRERFELEKAEKPLMAAKGTAATLLYLSNQEALDAYADGSMSPSDANAMSATIEWWNSQGSEKFSPYANDGQGGYIKQKNIVPSAALRALAARKERLGPDSGPDLDSPTIKFTKLGAPGSAAAYRFKTNERGETVIDLTTFQNDSTLIVSGGVDLTKSIGFGSGVNRVVSSLAEFLKDISFGLIGNDTTKRAQVTRAGDAQLKGLGLTTFKVLREDVDGRLFKLDMDKIEQEVKGFQPGAFGQDRGALAQLYMTRQMLVGQFEAIVNIANNSQTYGTKSTDAKITLPKIENLIGEFTAAIMIFERALDGNPNLSNQASDQVQSKTPSITGNAPRVTTGNPP